MLCCVLKENIWQVAQINLKSKSSKVTKKLIKCQQGEEELGEF